VYAIRYKVYDLTMAYFSHAMYHLASLRTVPQNRCGNPFPTLQRETPYSSLSLIPFVLIYIVVAITDINCRRDFCAQTKPFHKAFSCRQGF